MKITITAEIDDPNMIDDTNSTGLTGDAFNDVTEGLMELGFIDFDIKRA